MKILITGTTGFVGRAILEEMSKKHQVRCLVREKSSKKRGSQEIIEGDLIDKKTLDNATRKIDCVIHAAAILDADNPEIRKINVDATEELVNAAVKNKVKKFIFISTENVMHSCKDAYTKSKEDAEEKVRKFRNHLILREPIVYGPGDKRYIGKLIAMIKKWPCIPLPGKGDFSLQPIYVEDIPKYIEQGIKLNIQGTYLIAGKEAITYKELVEKIMRATQKKKRMIPMPIQLLKIIARMMEVVKLRPPLTTAQLRNMMLNRKYDIKNQIKIFKRAPTSLDMGLRKTLEKCL